MDRDVCLEILPNPWKHRTNDLRSKSLAGLERLAECFSQYGGGTSQQMLLPENCGCRVGPTNYKVKTSKN